MMGVFLTVIVTVPAKLEVPGLVSLRYERPCRFRDGTGGEQGLEVADNDFISEKEWFLEACLQLVFISSPYGHAVQETYEGLI